MNRTTLAIAGLTLPGLLLAGWSSIGIDAATNARVQASFQRLNTMDNELKQHVLAARHGVLHRYDPLVAAEAELAREAVELENTLDHTFADPKLASHAQALTAALNARRTVLERFKGENAILKNSLSYLPVALEHLHPALDETLYGEVQHVAQLALWYNVTPDPSLASQLRRAIDRAEATQPTLPEEVAFDRSLLLRHARMIVKGQENLEPTLSVLLDPTVSASVASYRQAYNERYVEAESRAKTSRAIFVGLVAVLLLLVVKLADDLRRLYGTLERRVGHRTRQLAAKSDDLERAGSEMRRILDNVAQGLVMVGIDTKLGSERSAILESWLGPPPRSGVLPDWLRPHDASAAEWLALGWMGLEDGLLPPEVVVDQLPSRIDVHGRFLGLEYQPILDADGNVERVLVVLTDITAEIQQARLEAEQRETLRVFNALATDRAGFTEFTDEGQELVDALAPELPVVLAKRIVHTLKGNSSVFGLDTLASCCHTIETRLDEDQQPLSADEIDRIREAWTAQIRRLAPFIETERGTVRISSEELGALGEAIRDRAPYALLGHVVDSWTKEPASVRLERLSTQATRIASRLGREIEIETEGGDLLLDPTPLGPFWSAFVHVLRNAVDHGIEPGDERVMNGKPGVGTLHITARSTARGLEIAVADDGRGIDWDAVSARAIERGLPCSTHEDRIAALFTDGFSTRSEVTSISGRGIGMAAAWSATKALGGSIEVESTPGRGTVFRFVFPGYFASERIEMLAQSA